MLKIVAARSLYHSIHSLELTMRRQLEDFVYTVPGLNLNSRSVDKQKNVYHYLKSVEEEDKHIVIWHDLINNTITPIHPTKTSLKL